VLTITGNPLGLAGPSAYQILENVIVNVLSATLINEKVNNNEGAFLKKESKNRMS
jgi:hypothetical protein